MGNSISLKQAYNEQLSFYPKLSQEEITALYESEGITSETIDEVISKLTLLINDKKQQLSLLNSEDSSKRLLNSIFGNNPDTMRISNLQKNINNLEMKVKELEILHKEMLKLLPPEEQTDNSMETTIKKLYQEIRKKKKKVEEEKTNQDTLNNEKANQKVITLTAELEELEEKVKKLKHRYENYSHKIYISTKGMIPRDRKFPSDEIRNQVVLGTIGIAKHWAKVYYYKEDNNIPFDDLYQVASETLMSAAHYYIPSNKAKFSTYARRCIENKLKHEVYNSKQRKKRPYKPDNFFEKEKDRIKYIQMFLEAMKIKSRSGKSKYYSKDRVVPTSVLLYRFKERISEFNREVRYKEEAHRLLPSFAGKRTKAKLDAVILRIATFIKESKIPTLITDEDRNLGSQLVNFQNRPKGLQEVYELLYFLDDYIYKIDLMEKYLKIEKELATQNDGIAPTDEEILKELNIEIKASNQERYKLKKEGFFENKMPYYEDFYNYYSEYLDKYKVDFFLDPNNGDYERIKTIYGKSGYKPMGKETFSSRQKEKDDIASEYEVDGRIYNLNSMMEQIDYCDSEKVVLYFTDDDIQIYGDWEEFDEDEDYDATKCSIFSKEEALERLRVIYASIPELSEEDYVRMILQQRKDEVNAILKEKNAPIIEQNREIRKERDKYDLGEKYQKHLTERSILDVKKVIELLYENDDELLILINSGRDKERKYHALPTEDDALVNVFLDDYYKSLEGLSELERKVLLMFFDKNGSHSLKAKEIGAELGITEGRVYKLKAKAIRQLKGDEKLQNYVEDIE